MADGFIPDFGGNAPGIDLIIDAGTYIAAPILDFSSLMGMSGMNGSFISNLGIYPGINIYSSFDGTILYGSSNPVYIAAEGSSFGFTGWREEAYRIITVETDIVVDSVFALWFSDNFTVVQGGGYHIPAGDYIGVSQPYCYLNSLINISFISDSRECTGIGVYSSFGGTLDYVSTSYVGSGYVYQYNDGNTQGFTNWKNEALRSIHVMEDAYLSSKDAWTQFCRIFAPIKPDSGDSGGSGSSGASITYNGETIASLTGGQTATLACGGKKMKGDVVITTTKADMADEYDGSFTKLISFTVRTYDGEIHDHVAVKNMKWGEWVESEYNTVGAVLKANGMYYPDAAVGTSDGMGYLISAILFGALTADTVIVAGHEYITD